MISRIGNRIVTIYSHVLRRGLNALFRFRSMVGGPPVPPAKLIRLVTGSNDVEWYLRSGKLAMESIVSLLKKSGVSPHSFNSVLDFGCGCGRVIQYWNSGGRTRLHGCDFNPRLTEWAEANLSLAQFETNDLSPPLAYADGQFDFVYCLSVFTHLAERLQRPWMQELSRVVLPEGYLLMSMHGAHYLEVMTPEERDVFKAGHLSVREPESAGSNVCVAFHPEQYIRNELAEGWRVIDFVPAGARGNPLQDLYLLKKI